MPVEVFMPLAEPMEEARQVANIGIRSSGELFQPGQERSGLVNAQRMVRTKRRQHLERQVCFRQRTMMSQVVRGIIRRADCVDAKLLQDSLCRESVGQRLVCGLPNPGSGAVVE